MPDPLGVTLSLDKFNKIVKIDPVSRTAIVQAGVRNLAISEAAAPFGLYYAPDPSSPSIFLRFSLATVLPRRSIYRVSCATPGVITRNTLYPLCTAWSTRVSNLVRYPFLPLLTSLCVKQPAYSPGLLPSIQ